MKSAKFGLHIRPLSPLCGAIWFRNGATYPKTRPSLILGAPMNVLYVVPKFGLDSSTQLDFVQISYSLIT